MHSIEQEGLFRRGYAPEREIFELNMRNKLEELRELAAEFWTSVHDMESILKPLCRKNR